MPRKNGKRMKTEKIAKWGRMNRYGVMGLSPMRRLRSFPDPQTSRWRSPPGPPLFRPGDVAAMELIGAILSCRRGDEIEELETGAAAVAAPVSMRSG
jgi:hypothetical protein